MADSKRLDKLVLDLQAAFDAVAEQISETYPQIWAKTMSVYTNENGEVDIDACVNFLISNNHVGWDGRSLIDVAKEHGEQAVENYISAIDAGVYM